MSGHSQSTTFAHLHPPTSINETLAKCLILQIGRGSFDSTMHGQDANLDLKQWMGFAENLGVATGGKPAGLNPNKTAAQEFLPVSCENWALHHSCICGERTFICLYSYYMYSNASEIQILHVKHLK